MRDTEVLRVQGVEGIEWAVPSYKGFLDARLANGTFQSCVLVRFEPYVLPKTSLTGDSTERVDTRVLQVIYGFHRGNLPIYVDQQMDVYIEAPGHPVIQ